MHETDMKDPNHYFPSFIQAMYFPGPHWLLSKIHGSVADPALDVFQYPSYKGSVVSRKCHDLQSFLCSWNLTLVTADTTDCLCIRAVKNTTPLNHDTLLSKLYRLSNITVFPFFKQSNVTFSSAVSTHCFLHACHFHLALCSQMRLYTCGCSANL